MRRRSELHRTGLLALLVAGCGGLSNIATTEGNASLGIVEFQVNQGKELTTIVGLDAQKREVARVGLFHGTFVPSEDLGQAPGASVDGRKLTVTVDDDSIAWETIGYRDLSHMPQLPRERARMGALLADQHVRPVLLAWKIGFDGPALGGNEDETAYSTVCDGAGAFSPAQCNTSANTCYAGQNSHGDGVFTQMCSGQVAASSGYNVVVDVASESWGTLTYNKFCCPSTGSSGSVGAKSCSSYGVCSGGALCDSDQDCSDQGQFGCEYFSSCGITSNTQKCKVCAGYPISYSSGCSISTSGDLLCHTI